MGVRGPFSTNSLSLGNKEGFDKELGRRRYFGSPKVVLGLVSIFSSSAVRPYGHNVILV